MKNLFIMHTQSNLIFACGIAKNYYGTDENHLILHAEFKLKDELLNALKNAFHKVLVVQDEFSNYSSTRNIPKREAHIYKLLYRSKEYFGKHFDNVFFAEASYWDTLFVSKLKVDRILNIEENSYISYTENKKKPTKIQMTKTKVREIYRRILFGKDKWNTEEQVNNMFDAYYVLYPDAVEQRYIDRNKPILEIDKQAFLNGIELLYENIEVSVKEGDKYIIFLADLLERYTKLPQITEFVKETARICREKNICLLIKYHPRETNKFDIAECDFEEVPYIIPAEKLMYSMKDKKTMLVGNLTSSVIMAPKMGMTSVSVMNICANRNNTAQRAYEKLGIKTPMNVNEFKDIVTEFAG